ncbi:MAG: hypothetical protein ACRBC3_11845 [Burkholderiaceae bacterium]
MKAVSLVAVCASLLVAGCSEKPAEMLTGCFATGANEPVSLKITEQDDESFELSSWGEKGWLTPATPLQAVPEAALKTVLSESAEPTAVLAGLQDVNGATTIYVLAEDTSIQGKPLDSQYLGVFFFGSGSLYKKDCPDD